MKKQRFILALGFATLCLTFVASGCGSKSSESPSTQAPAIAAPETISVPSASSTILVPVGAKASPRPPAVPLVVSPKLKIIRVNIANMAFSPQIIAVSAGDTVQWVNTDSVPHTVTSDGSLLWDSGTIKPGASFERQFKFAGSYPYHCGIHASMHGTVVIH